MALTGSDTTPRYSISNKRVSKAINHIIYDTFAHYTQKETHGTQGVLRITIAEYLAFGRSS